METRFARPWTPPAEDADRDDYARPDYFIDPFRRPSSVSSRASLRSLRSRRYDSSTESSRAKTKEPTPFTPKRVLSDHAPRYPFTPDSSQILRARSSTPHTPTSSLFTPDSSQLVRTRSSTPLSPIPWHDDHDGGVELSGSVSPVQDALSACISQFEHLIRTRRPTHDQMEYIVGQFEAMASYLSAQSADHDADKSPCPSPDTKHTTDAATKDAQDPSSSPHDDAAPHVPKEYVVQVEQYVGAVAKYIRDLQQRMEEVKTLNEIQFQVIDELRQQAKSTQQDMKTSLDAPRSQEDTNAVHGEDEEKQQHNAQPNAREDVDNKQKHDDITPSTREFSTQTSFPPSPSSSPRARKVVTIRQRPASIWASIGDALDEFGALLFDH